MTAKELSQVYFLRREIAREERHLAELEALATGTGGGSGGGSGGMHGDRTALAADIADLKVALEARRAACVAELSRLERYIASIDDSEMRLIMELRHCDCLSWRAVAARLGWGTADSVRMMHDRFLAQS